MQKFYVCDYNVGGCNALSSTFALELYVGFRFFTLNVPIAVFKNLLLIIAEIPKL
jgi:hypothetical protein